MRHKGLTPITAEDIARYFSDVQIPTQEESLGQIVIEILRSGTALNRPALCAKLVRRLEVAASAEEEQHYRILIGLLLGRQSAA